MLKILPLSKTIINQRTFQSVSKQIYSGSQTSRNVVAFLSGSLIGASIYNMTQRNASILQASSGGNAGNSDSSSGGGKGGSSGGKGDDLTNVVGEKKRKTKQNIDPVSAVIDQTVLKADCTWTNIQQACDEAKQNDFPAVCIPPSFVRQAKEYLKDSDVKIATVIGFPFGYSTTSVKVLETIEAVEDGADEIDMVINIGWLKSQQYEKVEQEIVKIKKATGSGILKVIVETGYLTEEEVREVTKIVDKAGADFIKTSTGYGPRGASMRDVEIFREESKRLLIKAAGGVRDREAALKFIELGVTRIGTSSGTKLIVSEPATASTGGY